MLYSIIETGLIYDIELYNNCFLVTFYSLKTEQYRVYKWYKDICDIPELIKLVTNKNRIRTLISYNGLNYDDVILNHIIDNFDKGLTIYELWQFSKSLINEEIRNPYKYKSNSFKTIDCMEILRVGRSSKTLKLVACNLKFPTIQDLPIHYDEEITDDNIDLLCSYNKNDVDITKALLYYLDDNGDLELREVLSDYYILSLHSSAESKIAKDLFDKFYYEKALEKNPNLNVKALSKLRTERRKIAIKDIVLSKIKFETETFQNFLNQLLELEIINVGDEDDESKSKFVCDIPELIFDGNTYTIALGGIHTVDKPAIIEADENYILLDADVTSQYPSAILYNKICPEHLDPDIFLPLLNNLVELRKLHKKKKKEKPIFKHLEKGEKTVCNTLYGLFNFKYYFLYDPLCTYRVTINNQLFILKLIEDLYLNGYSVLSANTDGIFLKIKNTDLENVFSIFKQWEQLSGFELEKAYFSKYVRRDINNYVAVKTDGERKLKGDFVSDGGLKKGWDMPIVAKALEAYYLDNMPIEDTIYNHRDIYDFCTAKKTDRKFTNILEYVKREIITTKTKTKKEIVSKQRTIPALIYEEETIDYGKSKRGKKQITKHIIADKVILPAETETIEIEVPLKNNRFKDIIISEESIQQTVRFYVTSPTIDNDGNLIGYSLKKEKQLDNGNKQRIDYCAGQFIKVFNNYYAVDNWEDYNINYDFYISCCEKIINKIGCIN